MAYNAVGLNTGGMYRAAIRLTPAELQRYAGWQIVSVIWFHSESGIHGDSVFVFGDGSASAPGPALASQPICEIGRGWFREDLESPVYISGTADLWACIQVSHEAGEHPIGVDDGPAIAGKGDFIYYHYNGIWQEMGMNWHIRAIVDFGIGTLNNDARVVSIDRPYWIVSPGTAISPSTRIRNQGLTAATFDVICNVDSAGSSLYSDTLSIFGLPSTKDTSAVFAKTWTPGAHGATYQVALYTLLPGDEDPANDTLTQTTFSFDTTAKCIVSPFAARLPTIDGTISPLEWIDAAMLDISDVYGYFGPPDPPGSCILYVKNDSAGLYVAVDGRADRVPNNWDALAPYFDDSHDHAFPVCPDSSEGTLWCFTSPGNLTCIDWFYICDPYGYGYRKRGIPFQFKTSFSSGHWQFELMIPFGTHPEELDASPGDTIGFFFEAYDTIAGDYGWWPSAAFDMEKDPSEYGDLVLSAAPVGTDEASIQPSREGIPGLLNIRPNPFASTTQILYSTNATGRVSLRICDISGRLVRTLASGTEEVGQHLAIWDTKDANGSEVGCGVYMCLFSYEGTEVAEKIILVR
jgi:hypothetical protein